MRLPINATTSISCFITIENWLRLKVVEMQRTTGNMENMYFLTWGFGTGGCFVLTFTWILQQIYMMLVAFDMTKKSRCLYCAFFTPREKHTVMFCLSRCENTLPPSLLKSHHVSFDTGTYLMSPPALRLPKAHNRRTEGQSSLPSFKSCPCKWDVLLTLAAPLRAIYAIAE